MASTSRLDAAPGRDRAIAHLIEPALAGHPNRTSQA
jgi:hypothetical protein